MRDVEYRRTDRGVRLRPSSRRSLPGWRRICGLTQVGLACARGWPSSWRLRRWPPSPRSPAGPEGRALGGDGAARRGRDAAACVIQVVVWRRAMLSWRGVRPEDLHAEAGLSWVTHLASYAVALVGLIACMAGSAEAGWTATAAVLLAFTLLMILAAQVLGGVQYLRPSGPPGTLPAHMRRLIERAQPRRTSQLRAVRASGGLGSVLHRGDEPVADVAHGADHRLVLGPELGPQPPDMDVDGAGAAVVVIAPDVAEQLLAAEHPPRMLRQVLQQLELGVGQVELRRR